MNRHQHHHHLVSIAILCLTLFMARTGRSESSAPDTASAGAVLDAFHKAMVSGDSKRVMSLLAPDALVVEAGTVQTRSEYESEHLAEDIAFARALPGNQTSRKIQEVGEAAWVTSTFRVTGRFRDHAIDNRAAETAVLTRTVGGWRIRTLHWSSHK